METERSEPASSVAEVTDYHSRAQALAALADEFTRRVKDILAKFAVEDGATLPVVSLIANSSQSASSSSASMQLGAKLPPSDGAASLHNGIHQARRRKVQRALEEHPNPEVRERAATAHPYQLNVLYKCGLHATAFLSGFRADMMRATVTVAELKFEIARQLDLNNLHAKCLHMGAAVAAAEEVKAIAFVAGAVRSSVKEVGSSEKEEDLVL